MIRQENRPPMRVHQRCPVSFCIKRSARMRAGVVTFCERVCYESVATRLSIGASNRQPLNCGKKSTACSAKLESGSLATATLWFSGLGSAGNAPLPRSAAAVFTRTLIWILCGGNRRRAFGAARRTAVMAWCVPATFSLARPLSAIAGAVRIATRRYGFGAINNMNHL